LAMFGENVYIETLAYYSVVVLCTIVFLAIFELLTRYRNWVEIRNGNMAVAMATGGKIFGIANIFRFTIGAGEPLSQTIVQGVFGFVLLMVGYFIFEFLTPSFKIDAEIEKGNTAVGFMAMVISIGLSYVIGASLTG
jgi:putative membrane protein